MVIIMFLFGNRGEKKGALKENDRDLASSLQTQTQKIEQLIVDIMITKRRLEGLLGNLQARDKNLIKRIADCQEKGDEFKAQGLTRELLQIRKIANLAVYSSYMLEVVKLRLDTIRFVGVEVLPTLRLIKPILSEARETISKVIPGSEIAVKDIEDDLLEIMAKTGTSEIPIPVIPETTQEEAKKIMEDVRKMALDKISQTFPEVPELNDMMENTVFEYVMSHKNNFLLKIAEKELPLSRIQIIAALKSLDLKGKIHIEYSTEEEQIT